MEEEKRKKIEARLNQLFAEQNQNENSEIPMKQKSSGIRLIRRRKGNPDKHIS